MLRAALESGLPVCVLEKVRGAWDEARDVRERVASRRGTAEVVVDAKRAEDALKAEAELLSLLDDEEAKASRASKKKQKRKKKKVVKAPAVVAAPAVVHYQRGLLLSGIQRCSIQRGPLHQRMQ